ncbi:transposase family protein [Streptomyces sp. NPDC020799]|uniref:transposase family protein n=1 Tax=Streptomyces sp. NPDC020799 TaxID=3365091 RepID=UPI0037A22682
MSPYQLSLLVGRVERWLPDWDRALGRSHVLPLWKAVILLCFLLRHDAVQEMAGELFGCSQPTVSRYGSLLRPVVRDSLKRLGFGIGRLPRGEPVLVDGFLAPCWDWKAAEQLFSAKHRRCGHNIQVISDLRGRLRAVGRPLPGAQHDAFAFTASGVEAAVGRHPGLGDKGYQGSNLLTPYNATWGWALDGMTGIRSARTRQAVIMMRAGLARLRRRGARPAQALDDRARVWLHETA